MRRTLRRLIMLSLVTGLVVVGYQFTAVTAAPVQLSYMIWGQTEQVTEMKRILDDFERAHPNIQVKLEVPSGDYWTALAVRFAGGSAPDVFWMNEPFVQYRDSGALLDLAPFLSEDKDIVLANYFPSTTKFYVSGNHVWGIPKDVNVDVVYYRTDLFDQAGLSADPNWTWAQFENAIRKLTQRDANGRLKQVGFVNQVGGVMSFIVQNGNDVYDPATNKLLLNRQDAVDAIEWYKRLLDQKLVASPSDLAGFAQFADPRVAMYLGARWGRIFYGKTNLDWDILPQPRQVRQGTVMYVGATCIASSTKHPKEAWELLKWMVGETGQTRYWGQLGESIPALRSAVLKTILLPPPASARFYVEVLEKSSVFLQTPWMTDNWGKVADIINAQLSKVWSGKMAPAAAMAEAVEAAAPILAKARRL